MRLSLVTSQLDPPHRQRHQQATFQEWSLTGLSMPLFARKLCARLSQVTDDGKAVGLLRIAPGNNFMICLIR
jgi:hypothetical protein